MSAPNIQRRRRRRALITAFALMAVTPMLSCSSDGDPITDVDEIGRFDAIAELKNLQSTFWNGTQYTRGGSAHLTIPAAGENPPCCLVIEGSDRLKAIRVVTGETWFIRAYDASPGVTLDVNHYSQTRCRVTATQPTGSQSKPVLTVLYNNVGATQLTCFGGWENF